MSGWSELGAALAGGDSLQRQKLAMAGYQAGSRQAGLLEDARTKRDKNMGLQSITPELVGSVVSGRDPVTGQAFVPEAMDSLQGQLVNGLLHAGIDPRELSGYQKDQQGIGFGNRAMEVATAPDADLNLLNRINMVRSGKPVNLSTIQDGTLLSAMVTPDQQAAVGGNTPTQVGLADIMAKGARADASNASAVAAHARARNSDAMAGVHRKNSKPDAKPTVNMAPLVDMLTHIFSGDAGGAPAAAAPGQPAAAVEPRRAPDGNLYVPDPNRPGKWLRVDG